MTTPAVLALEDGTVFRGVSIGANGNTTGEVVFNTAMTGYQEILTDPSYSRQIVTLTYPHIGNTGTNPGRSRVARGLRGGAGHSRPAAAAFATGAPPESLREFLARGKIVAIADIDTRKLTRILREKGAQAGCIMTRRRSSTPTLAVARRAQVPGSQGHGPRQGRHDQARLPVERGHELGSSSRAASVDARHSACTWSRSTSASSATSCAARRPRLPHDRRAGADDGRRGAGAAARRRVPLERPRRSGALRLRDRGDPRVRRCRHAGLRHLPRPPAARARERREDDEDEVRPPRREPPGARPRDRPRVITSQNHGFAVDESDAAVERASATHRSLFDGSLQGIARTDKPAFSFQGHPEASPGPHDLTPLFERFVDLDAEAPRNRAQQLQAAIADKRLTQSIATCQNAPTSKAS